MINKTRFFIIVNFILCSFFTSHSNACRPYTYKFITIKQYSDTIRRSVFFSLVTGYNEQAFLKLLKQTPIDPLNFSGKTTFDLVGPDNNGHYFFNIKPFFQTFWCGTPEIVEDEESFQAGKFETLSIADLRKFSDDLFKKVKPQKAGHFNVVHGVGTKISSSFRSQVDIGALQANPENQDAVFQVASNFNGLEACGNPNDGIEAYLNTTAQGEEASISALPGAIFRMYFLPHIENGKPYVGQLEKQINFLDKFDGTSTFKIPVYNGYINFDNKNQCPNLSDKELEKYLPLVKIGYHEGIQVTTGLAMLNPTLCREPVDPSCCDPREQWTDDAWDKCGLHTQSLEGYNALVDKHQIIDQVFTAAVNLANSNNANQKHIENLAKMLLFAAYEGTLRAAFIKEKKKVFLTLIGGGVFLNKFEWIAESLERMAGFIEQSGLDVTLIIYNRGEHDAFANRMKQLANEFHGTYTLLK